MNLISTLSKTVHCFLIKFFPGALPSDPQEACPSVLRLGPVGPSRRYMDSALENLPLKTTQHYSSRVRSGRQHESNDTFKMWMKCFIMLKFIKDTSESSMHCMALILNFLYIFF